MKTAKFSQSLTISLSPEAYRAVKSITDERHTSMADYVREAVDEALKKEPSQDELRF